MILSKDSLLELGPYILDPFDPSLVNPASIDIRIGDDVRVEIPQGWSRHDMKVVNNLWIYPGEFLLASTYECLRVPKNCAVELRLKSSRAREGWNHSLAFWFDPGWNGIGTMEISNITKYKHLALSYGMKFAQIIVHRLDGEAQYNGRYQHATGVENSKG